MIGGLVNGKPADCVSIADRGLLYGDGLFETLLVEAGRPQLWDYHLQRLQRDCRILKLAGRDQASRRKFAALRGPFAGDPRRWWTRILAAIFTALQSHRAGVPGA